MARVRLPQGGSLAGAVLLLVWSWTLPALATTLLTVDFACALCGEKFTDKVVGSTSSAGGQDSELRPRYLGLEPMPYFIHACPRCHFCDASHKTALAEPAKSKVLAFLKDYCGKHDCQNLRPSQKFALAAKTMEIRGLPPLKIAEASLAAAWMADDEGNQQAATDMRRQASRFLVQCLEGKEVEEEMRPNLTYMVGELHRRLGNFPEALTWFNRVETAEPHFVALVKQQKDLAAKHNADRAKMPSMD